MVFLLAGVEADAEDDFVTIRVDPKAVTPELVHLVAKAVAPESVLAREGQTLGEVVEGLCGRVDQGYLAIVRSQGIVGLPAEIDAETRFSRTMQVELPACLRLDRFVPIRHVVEEDERIWSYFQEDRAGFDSFDSLPQGTEESKDDRTSYLAAFKDLNPGVGDVEKIFPGDELLVPRTGPAWASLRLRGDLAISLEELSAAVEKHLVAGGQAQETVTIESNLGLKIYSQLDINTLKRFGDCQHEVAAGPEEAMALAELLEVLAWNIAYIKSNPERSLRSATIVIPDTGLRIQGERPFGHRRLRRTRHDYNSEIRPYERYGNRMHGTYVATLALGGESFMQMMDWLDLDLRLRPFHLVEERRYPCGEPGGVCWLHEVRPDKLSPALQEAKHHNAVVNLSIGQAEELFQVKEYLTDDSPILFVAAAGNEGEDLDRHSVYPARYGGTNRGRSNVITVAALDLDGSRAAFSNYGAKYVDIAAPGCFRPVLDYDSEAEAFRLASASGTSFAAPQVAFTAGLLRAMWPIARPQDLKRRILTSATLSLLLMTDEVADRRQLDPVKALAIFQDVVEARIDGRKRLLRGRVDPGRGIWRFCNGDVELYRNEHSERSVIKKIAVLPGEYGTFKLFIYSVDPGGQLQSHECPAEGLSIQFREDFTGWTHSFGPEDLLDVVFAEPSA